MSKVTYFMAKTKAFDKKMKLYKIFASLLAIALGVVVYFITRDMLKLQEYHVYMSTAISVWLSMPFMLVIEKFLSAEQEGICQQLGEKEFVKELAILWKSTEHTFEHGEKEAVHTAFQRWNKEQFTDNDFYLAQRWIKKMLQQDAIEQGKMLAQKLAHGKN